MLASSGPAAGGTRARAARDPAERSLGISPWPGIQVRHLAALEAVAEEASFSKAAKRLGYTQSAISQQVAALEKIVGVQLVVRPERFQPVTPTPQGEIILEQAKAILAGLRTAHSDLRALREGHVGVVHVGIFPGLGSRLAGALAERFPLGEPGVQLRLVNAAADAELLEPLARGELDLTFATFPLEPGPLEGEELLREEFRLVVPAGDELAAKPNVTATDLDGIRLVCLRCCRATRAALTRLEAQGIRPDVVYRSDDSETLLGLVRAGATAALLPELSLGAAPGAVVIRSLDSPHLERRIGLAWRRARTPAGPAEDFLRAARAALRACDDIVAAAS